MRIDLAGDLRNRVVSMGILYILAKVVVVRQQRKKVVPREQKCRSSSLAKDEGRFYLSCIPRNDLITNIDYLNK